MTPAKYELDTIQVTTVFIIQKKWKNNGTDKIGLVTPHSSTGCQPPEDINWARLNRPESVNPSIVNPIYIYIYIYKVFH